MAEHQAQIHEAMGLPNLLGPCSGKSLHTDNFQFVRVSGADIKTEIETRISSTNRRLRKAPKETTPARELITTINEALPYIADEAWLIRELTSALEHASYSDSMRGSDFQERLERYARSIIYGEEYEAYLRQHRERPAVSIGTFIDDRYPGQSNHIRYRLSVWQKLARLRLSDRSWGVCIPLAVVNVRLLMTVPERDFQNYLTNQPPQRLQLWERAFEFYFYFSKYFPEAASHGAHPIHAAASNIFQSHLLDGLSDLGGLMPIYRTTVMAGHGPWSPLEADLLKAVSNPDPAGHGHSAQAKESQPEDPSLFLEVSFNSQTNIRHERPYHWRLFEEIIEGRLLCVEELIRSGQASVLDVDPYGLGVGYVSPKQSNSMVFKANRATVRLQLPREEPWSTGCDANVYISGETWSQAR